MRIVITGYRGLIGKTLFDYFKNYIEINGWGEEEKQYKVMGLDFQDIDFTNEDHVKSKFVSLKADALINCFALNDHIQKPKPWRDQIDFLAGKAIMTLPLDYFDAYLKTNVTALFSVCREFRRNNLKGSIVNFASTYGLGSPRPDIYGDGEKHIAYGVSKAAVIQLTKHLATHWAPDMRVNCIAPGGVENGQSEEFKADYSKHTPMGRMAKVGEICGLVEYLISDKASYCTGGIYPVDGGWTAW